MMPLIKNLRVTPASIDAAKDWFQKKLKDLHVSASIHGIGHSKVNIPLPGHMFLFHYDAKTKATLPYWDNYPMVLPFNVESDRFWGLNLHYLPPDYRLMLLAALSKLIVDSKISDQKRLEMSWAILKESSRLPYIEPCVKQYLLSGNHVKSNFLMVDSNEWLHAVMLPLEAFKGRDKLSEKEKYVSIDKKDVWRDSLRRT